LTATEQQTRVRTQRSWLRLLAETRTETDADAAANSAADPAGATKTMAVVAITAALALTTLNFFAYDPTWLVTTLDRLGLAGLALSLRATFFENDYGEFWRLVHWASVQIASYVVFPLVACRYLKLSVRDLGLSWRGKLRHGRAYLPLLAISLPFVALASLRSDFLSRYPFYQPLEGDGIWPYLAFWWLLYGLQFVALEFFFRGFLVHGLKHRLGFGAVFAMVIPYNMLHFQKPLLEALAAIVGGTVLGVLSLRYRSIWWGVALHLSVAGAMDVLSLLRQGWF